MCVLKMAIPNHTTKNLKYEVLMLYALTFGMPGLTAYNMLDVVKLVLPQRRYRSDFMCEYAFDNK